MTETPTPVDRPLLEAEVRLALQIAIDYCALAAEVSSQCADNEESTFGETVIEERRTAEADGKAARKYAAFLLKRFKPRRPDQVWVFDEIRELIQELLEVIDEREDDPRGVADIGRKRATRLFRRVIAGCFPGKVLQELPKESRAGKRRKPAN